MRLRKVRERGKERKIKGRWKNGREKAKER
jgi:hypothetical protein